MKSLSHMLVALDLSAHGRSLSSGSRLAAEHALTLAPALEAKVRLFHSSATDEVWDEQAQQYVQAPERAAETPAPILDETLALFRNAGISAELEVSPESAWLGIVRCVLRDGVDLVLSGKRNEPDRWGQRLGSVSNKLLRKCPCAVWVVKPGGETRPRRILAATDLTAVGDRVVEYAAFVADLFDAELHVVHAFQRPLAIQMEGDEASANFERVQRKERIGRIEAEIERSGTKRDVSVHVGLTSPTQAVLAASERLDPDLVVMGTVSRGGVAGMLVGNTAERLLGRLDCSLLTVKPDDFVCPVSLDG